MKRSAQTQEKKVQEDSLSEQSHDSDIEQLEPGTKRANMPKKSKFRMRAHINPFNDLVIPV